MSMSNFFNYPTDEPTAEPILVDLAFWGQRGSQDWKKLLMVIQTIRFRPNEIVVRAGQKGDGFYIIGGGLFHVNGKPIEEGQAIGYHPFLDKQPHPHTIQAITEGDLLYLSHTAFDTFAAHEPALARSVLFELGRILSLTLRASY